MFAFIFLAFAILRKKYEKVEYRIYTLAVVFANVGFFGMPVIEAILDSHPEAVIYSSVFSVIMNILAWTLASAIISQDRKYISIRKAILNPAAIVVIVAIPLMIFGIEFPPQISTMFTLLGKFSTPLCMIIMGMRLATVNLKELLTVKNQYLTSIVKNVAVPLISFPILYFLPINSTLKMTIFILTCCPIANINISFAEFLGRGQKTAANIVLISTLGSIATMPVILMLLKFL
jgi:predicted permease